ncbi:MAG TPA: N-6 DNA methylase [Vicinamibacterales bacterium]|nr:N-6 DNA methylase [Vicinamibacterales bacterium]
MTNSSDQLRAIRAKLNLTQEQLAERLGVSFATVNRWEGGANAPQKAAREVIAALAREAGLDDSTSADSAVDSAAGVTRRRRSKVGAAQSTKSMEQMLWDAACSIRGEKDAPKFKDYLLPLLFLKRLSDVFDDEIARLAEDYGDRHTALEIAEADHSLLRFYLPPEARWAAINGREPFEWSEAERPRDVGEHLTKAVRAVVKHNPTLSGVIDIVDFAAERNAERDINPAKLRDVVETYSDPRYRLGLADVQPDFLGRAYEYLLRKFAEGSGQSAGEFFTPTEVGFLMAHIMRPKPGEDCHDYACGSAGLLVKLQLVARELDPTSRVPLKLTGQERQAESYALAQMNGIIHDITIELARGDTMINPKFRTADGRIKTHDIVVANPMWNQPFAPDVFANDPFDRFRTTGGITTGKGDWAWLQHTLACLNDRGRAAVILDTGAVMRGEDRERIIRKWFVDRDLIDGVILLPENLFYNTSSAAVLIVLNKRKPASRSGQIVLLNASRHFRKGRPKNYLPEDAIRNLAAMFLKGEPVDGELAVITKQRAGEADYNLSPSRWVQTRNEDNASDLRSLLNVFRAIELEAHAESVTLATLLAPLQCSDVGEMGTGTKETEIGQLPQPWDVVPFDESLKIAQGQVDPKEEPYASMLHVGPENVEPHTGQLLHCQPAKELGLISGKYLFAPGDIIYSKIRPYLNKVVMPSFEGICSADMYPLRATEGFEARFVFHYLLSEYFLRQAVPHQLRTGIPKINREQLSDTAFPRPSIEEQRDVAAVLDLLRRHIDIHRRKLTVLEELYRSLLHKLMAGEVCVDKLDLSALHRSAAARAESQK